MVLNKIRAALFDMDQTLIPTEFLAQLVWTALSWARGFKVDPLLMQQFISRSMADCEAIAREQFGEAYPYRELKAVRNEVLPRFLDAYGIAPMEGVEEMLDFLSGKGILLAVNTSSDRDTAEKLLKAAGIYDRFRVVVGGDDSEVTKGKPDPLGFQVTARRLGVSPQECLVFEDSGPGIQAAHAAGTVPILIPGIVAPADEIQTLASQVFPTMVEAREFLVEALK